MANRIVIQPGDRFGRLTVDHLGEIRKYASGNSARFWVCICDCGTRTKHINGTKLTSGHTRSCGCIRKEMTAQRNFQSTGIKRLNREPRGSADPLYGAWNTMLHRCNSPKSGSYERYGGRGIKVCTAWQESFFVFRDWALANGWQKGLSIDRIDNDGNYEPENCRFVDNKTQANNRSTTKLLTAFGETKTITEWAKDDRCRVTRNTLGGRVLAGWDVEQALIRPSQIKATRLRYFQSK